MNATVEATAAYVDAVRTELADLPGDEVAEIIEDVKDHLDQVAAELGDGLSPDRLAERLGTPAEYAAELRAAAGYPTPGQARRINSAPLRLLRGLLTWSMRAGAFFAIFGGLAHFFNGPLPEPFIAGMVLLGVSAGLWWLARGRPVPAHVALRELPDVVLVERAYGRIVARPWGQSTIEFVRSLRPAWWAVRAWVATQLIVYLLGGTVSFPLPNSPFAVALLGGLIAASVWWGRRTASGEVPQGLNSLQFVANTVLAVAAPIMVAIASSVPTYVHAVYEPEYAGFFHEDGTPITNLYLYGPDGQMLEGVRIYDQEGRPVDNLHPGWDECDVADRAFEPANVFPRSEWRWDDERERCLPRTDGPFGSLLPGTPVDEDSASGGDVSSDVRPDPAEDEVIVDDEEK